MNAVTTPALVSGSVYSVPETSPLTAAKPCPECGTTIPRPRRNQTFCCAACREAHTARRQSRNIPPKMGACPHCGTPFEKTRKARAYCCDACKTAEANFWKARGPSLGAAMMDWRVTKRKGAFTDLGRVFSRAREDLSILRANAHAAKGNPLPAAGRRRT